MRNLASRSCAIQAVHCTGQFTSVVQGLVIGDPASTVSLSIACVGIQSLALKNTPCNAGEDAIKHLLSRGTHREFGYTALVTMLVVYFLGAVWAAGSAIASGLFVPMLLIGSCIGRIVGLICVDMAASGGHGSPRLVLMLPSAFYHVEHLYSSCSRVYGCSIINRPCTAHCILPPRDKW